MTDLQVRRIPFEFDETVPFQWHPTNPEFGLMMNAVSFLVIGFERYIVAAVRDALPLIDDEHVTEEADAFMRQEAVHARAHRGHVKAMIRQFPPLQGTLDAALASYDHLLATKPLEFHLAYIADMEATFTPNFKLFLDNCDELFEPGDRRVASLFAWHFVEEIEHRSSAVIVYDSVVGRPWYRLRVVPQVSWHVRGVYAQIIDDFCRHVPLEATVINPGRVHPLHGPTRRLKRRLPVIGRSLEGDDRFPQAYACVPKDQRKVAVRGVLRSQRPGHDPAHEPLPAYADSWFEAYDRGDDMTNYEGTAPSA